MEGNEIVVEVPAMVSVPTVGTEVPAISKERWEEMHRMRAEGQSVSQIARATGLDRKTVRATLGKTESATSAMARSTRSTRSRARRSVRLPTPATIRSSTSAFGD